MSLLYEDCYAVYFSICFSSHSLPCPMLQKYVTSDDFFILRGQMKRCPVSDNNLLGNCWSKKNPCGLFTRQHNRPNRKAWSGPKVQAALLCTWCQGALHGIFSIIYPSVLQEYCFISGNEAFICHLKGWLVQFIWSDVFHKLKERRKLELTV